MPIIRYIVCTGTALLALLIIVNWFLPEPPTEPMHHVIERPVIRITSIQQPPEPVVIDTSQPTIVPPATLYEAPHLENKSSLQSYASVASLPMATNDDRKKKTNKRKAAKVAPYQPPLMSGPAIASGSPANANPLTKLSFSDIISGQLVRNLFSPN